MQRFGWVKAGVWLMCGVLAGCSKKPSPTAAPAPLTSASASFPPAPAEAQKEPEPPKPALSYLLAHHFGKVSFFPLVNGVLACSDCAIGSSPNDDRQVFFFDGKDAKELPGLLSDKRVSANIGVSVTKLLKPFGGGKYTFSGTGPNQLELEVYGYLDDGSGGRQGYPHEERNLTFDGKSWQMGSSGYPKNDALYGHDRRYVPTGELPRKYDNARLHSGIGFIVASDDGPVLEIAGNEREATTPYVGLWDGKVWNRQSAPWDSIFVVVRLVGGRTLVLASDGAYGVDAQGVASPIPLGDPAPRGDQVQLVLVGREPWLLTPTDVFVPTEPKLRASIAVAREPAPIRPPPRTALIASAAPIASDAPVASAAPIASASPSAAPNAVASAAPSAIASATPIAIASAVPSAAPSPIASAVARAAASSGVVAAAPGSSADAGEPLAPGIAAMTGFSASCKTPFVVLFTPPQPRWNYSDAIANLVDAAPQQDSLWFAEFTRNKVTYFGAQAADEAAARALIAAYVGRVPKAKPVLGCLDMKAYLPDPYTPKWDGERLLINLRSGLIL